MTSRQLTCLYSQPFIFPVYISPKIANKLDLQCILAEILILLIFEFGWQLGWGEVHAGLSAVSDCAMVRNVRVTNGMQELKAEEDSLEPRQVGSW